MLDNLIIFVLAAFVGFEVISKVPQTLHTPLMSGSNAISGITIVGALVVAGMVGGTWSKWLGMVALIAATINVVGGFLVTDRMLQMFKARERRAPAQAPAAKTEAAEPATVS
ncbi:NAD(P) transhydrogenase subunit alpha [Rhodothermus profundi]|uniref:proton-translocating NAD(P)(+) transhydrogenase n=2 Tax=Rhodothermus profundi TaxID=633813 RepID=A0A1M6PU16_9BACT|nr:NAD(P) transhydrogenase subunit alpha [Rhodothermus profundi]SHK11380.1 NAD(P) transhydrogenase subunit alpha [Rhodothermus profundi]